MTIFLQSVVVKHEQRIRLVFTNTLAGGAFGLSPVLYTVTNQDGRGPSPLVSTAMIVTGSPAVVELALSTPLAEGALYKVFAEAVPAVDASVTAADTNESFRYGTVPVETNVENTVSDRQLLLFGIDLLWDGLDFRETARGDLERIGGTANVTKALHRGLNASGLPHAPQWGAFAREYVDSPVGAAGTLSGSVLTQALRDPRVKSARIAFTVEGASTFLIVTPQLVSGDTLQPVSLRIPNGS